MPMINRPLGDSCTCLDYFQSFLSPSSISAMQYLQSSTLLPQVSSLFLWVDWRQDTLKYQPLSTRQCKELPKNHIRVTMTFIDSTVTHHSQYCIHWRTFLLQLELAFHNQPLKCKTWIILCLEQLHIQQWIVWSHQMAWIRFSSLIVVARLVTKSFINSSSFTEPDSNPRESWKTKRELLRKMSSSSMLCSPLWMQLVPFMLPAKHLTRLQWTLYGYEVNLWFDTHQGFEGLRVRMHLTFSPLALNISGSSVVLQTRCNSVVLPAFDLPITRILNRPIRSKCFLTCAESKRKSSSIFWETIETCAESIWCVSSVPIEMGSEVPRAGPVFSIGGEVEACSESTQRYVSSILKETDEFRAGSTWCLSSGCKETSVAWVGSGLSLSSTLSETDVTRARLSWLAKPAAIGRLPCRWWVAGITYPFSYIVETTRICHNIRGPFSGQLEYCGFVRRRISWKGGNSQCRRTLGGDDMRHWYQSVYQTCQVTTQESTGSDRGVAPSGDCTVFEEL